MLVSDTARQGVATTFLCIVLLGMFPLIQRVIDVPVLHRLNYLAGAGVGLGQPSQECRVGALEAVT